jgi:hypothetical protein
MKARQGASPRRPLLSTLRCPGPTAEACGQLLLASVGVRFLAAGGLCPQGPLDDTRHVGFQP